jgi:hypothetical protein
MTAHRDPDRLIQAFLDEGLTELPDRAYDAVRAEIDRTRQRVVFGPWREPRMSNFSRFAIAAVAIVAVVAVGVQLMPRPGGNGTVGATPTASPSIAPAAAPSSTSPTLTPERPTSVSNGWIAYSTMPGVGQNGFSDTSHGGDIYLVREGVQPKLVEGRGEGMTRNVCPAFSPDGTMLAFGQSTSIRPSRAVVVVGVNTDGSVTDVVNIPVGPTIGPAPCPLWSVDGTRVAFLEGEAVVVRGLDGSSPANAVGDPAVGDFVHEDVDVEQFLSPTGDWMVQRAPGDPPTNGCRLAVARPNGSDSRIVDTQGAFCFYSIAAWSPDGQRVLLMEDVSGMNFTMHAASIDPSRAMITIVSRVKVNGSRSWPGRGDVSWQPVYP